MKREGTFDRELIMTTSTLVSFYVVLLGLLSNLLRRSAGIGLNDLLAMPISFEI